MEQDNDVTSCRTHSCLSPRANRTAMCCLSYSEKQDVFVFFLLLFSCTNLHFQQQTKNTSTTSDGHIRRWTWDRLVQNNSSEIKNRWKSKKQNASPRDSTGTKLRRESSFKVLSTQLKVALDFLSFKDTFFVWGRWKFFTCVCLQEFKTCNSQPGKWAAVQNLVDIFTKYVKMSWQHGIFAFVTNKASQANVRLTGPCQALENTAISTQLSHLFFFFF